MTPELERLLGQCASLVKRMTPDEFEAMRRAQRASYVRAELSWPKPKYHWEDGVKVYESYEDYCNG